MRTFFSFLSFLVLLSACSTPSPIDTNSSSTERSGPIAIDEKPVYTDYTEGVAGYGRSSILFFAKSGDPFSHASDTILRAAYASGSAKYSTYRIDADTATGTKLRFSVFVPDTFVLLDTFGKRIGSVVHPTATELRTLLKTGSLPQ